MSVGGFMGINEKHVAVPINAIRPTKKNGKWRLIMNATKEVVKSAPGFKYDRSLEIWKNGLSYGHFRWERPQPRAPPSFGGGARDQMRRWGRERGRDEFLRVVGNNRAPAASNLRSRQSNVVSKAGLWLQVTIRKRHGRRSNHQTSKA